MAIYYHVIRLVSAGDFGRSATVPTRENYLALNDLSAHIFLGLVCLHRQEGVWIIEVFRGGFSSSIMIIRQPQLRRGLFTYFFSLVHNADHS